MKDNNHKYKDLAINTVIFSISSFGSKLLSFFLVPLYTAFLSTEDYGTADFIGTTSTLLIFVLTIDISDAVLRFAIERRDNQKDILSFGVKIQLIGTTVLGVGLVCIKYSGLLKWENYVYIFLLLMFFLNSCQQTITNYLRATDKLKEVAIGGIIQTLFSIAANILLLVVMNMGLIGFLLSGIVGSAIATVYYFSRCETHIIKLFNSKLDKTVQKEMIRYSFPLIFNGVAWWINSSLDKYFIIYLIGLGASGIYAVSYKIPTIMVMFNQIFAQAWNLSAIKEFDKEDEDGFFSKTYSVYNAGLVLCCSSLIICNVILAKFLYSKDFFEAWNYTSPLLISIIFSALSSFIGSIFTAVKNSKIFAISTVTAAVVNTMLNVVLIPLAGVMGAAIATAVSFYVIWLVRMIYVRKYIKLKINLKRDLFAYLLLGVQSWIEHFNSHNYLYQSVVCLILVLLYLKETIAITTKITKLASRYYCHNKKYK